MKKVSKPFQKKGHKGWFIRWFDNKKQVTRCLPTKAIADHYRHIKYQELNFEVFRQAVSMIWEDVKAIYLQRFDLEGLAVSTKKEARWFFNRFEKVFKPAETAQVTQRLIDNFIIARQKANVSPHTINKDIAKLKTFLAWLKEHNYHEGGIKLKAVKAPQLIRKALSDESIQQLLKRCPDDAWRLKVLLNLTTDTRKNDVDMLRVENVNLEEMKVEIIAQKTQTHKILIIHSALKKLVEQQVAGRKEGYLFDGIDHRRQWSRFSQGVTRQELRVTNKTLLQMIGNLDSVRGLIGHADYATTKKYYSDIQLIEIWKTNQLDVKKWLNY